MRYQLNEFEIDTDLFQIVKNGQVISVEPKVFDLIVYLIDHRNIVVSRDELFEKVWFGREVSDTSLSNHIKSARKILGDNGDLQLVIKTLRGRGYQFIADVSEISNLVRSQPQTSLAHKRLYQFSVAFLLVIIAILLVVDFPSFKLYKESNQRIAVLPFNNIKADKETDFLGFALADQIIGDLAYLNNLTVRASGSIRGYQQQVIDPQAVGEALDVEYILMGTYLKESGDIRLNIELIEIHSQQMIWRESIVGDFKSSFKLQDIVAKRVAKQLKIQFSPQEFHLIEKEAPLSPLAYEYYLRAISSPHTNEGAKISIEILQKAISLDPSFAANYVELAARTNFLAIFNLGSAEETEKAVNYYQQALQLDKNSKGALAGLAAIYAETGKTDKAINLTRQLIALNPKDAQAHFSLGYIYRYAGMLDESISAIKTAIKIDPNSRWSHVLGATYTFKGEYQNALKALDVGEESPYSMGWKASIYLHQGDNEQAIEYLDRIIKMEPGSFWELDSIGFKSVINNDYKTGLQAAAKLEAANINDAEAIFYWSGLYALLGDKKSCLRMLSRSIELGYFNYYLMATESFLDSVREEAEFKTLLKIVEQKHFLFKNKYFD